MALPHSVVSLKACNTSAISLRNTVTEKVSNKNRKHLFDNDEHHLLTLRCVSVILAPL